MSDGASAADRDCLRFRLRYLLAPGSGPRAVNGHGEDGGGGVTRQSIIKVWIAERLESGRTAA
jgi:hypothetical protein